MCEYAGSHLTNTSEMDRQGPHIEAQERDPQPIMTGLRVPSGRQQFVIIVERVEISEISRKRRIHGDQI